MEKPKFTQGPWTLHANGDGTYSILGEKLNEKEYRWVARFFPNGEPLVEELEANARLIAKAPEMYDAMRLFCDRVDRGEVRSTKTYNQFKEILNKIDG